MKKVSIGKQIALFFPNLSIIVVLKRINKTTYNYAKWEFQNDGLPHWGQSGVVTVKPTATMGTVIETTIVKLIAPFVAIDDAVYDCFEVKLDPIVSLWRSSPQLRCR